MSPLLRGASQKGLSLLEMLVAFSIMAMALGVLYRVTGGSVRSVSAIDATQRAASLAESLLSLRDSVPENGWADAGETGGYAWAIHSTPYPTVVSNSVAPPLHEVNLDIRWVDAGVARSLHITTLRPERKPLPGGITR